MGHKRARVVVPSAVMVASAVALCAAVWDIAGHTVLDIGGRVGAGGPGVLATLAFEQVLTALCATALLACAAWLLAVTSLVGLEAVADTATQGSLTAWRLRARLCPDTIHRLLLAGCGVALATGLHAPTAFADTAGSAVDPGAAFSGAGASGRLSGLPLPDRTVGPPSRPRPAAGVLSVTAGDSLWSLAHQALGGRPTDAQTTRAWRALYRANLDRIGKDPDLIFPGTELQIPDLASYQRKEPT